LKRLRVPKEELTDAVNLVEQVLLSTIKDKQGQWLISKEHDDEKMSIPFLAYIMTGLSM